MAIFDPNRDAEARIWKCAYERGARLDLRGLGLTDLPPSVRNLRELQFLNVGHNRLYTLPDWITELKELSIIIAEQNRFTALPESIRELPELQSLYFSHNRITALPEWLGSLKQLLHLDLDGNLLEMLPSSLANLTNLRSLWLSYNPLYELAGWIDALRNLRRLDLRNCGLVSLPASLGDLPELKTLDVSDNQLTDAPDSLERLEEVDLRRNPFTGDVAEVAERGWGAVREYLRSRAQSETPQWRAKLMLVGEGGVGKSNLLRRLRGEPFLQTSDPTHNLEIRPLSIQHPVQPGVTLDLRAWDFGGQVFFHATHQFFYTGKSVFLLVWNARDNFEESKLGNWLDRIQALAPGAPIALVATHSKHFTANIPVQALKEKYPQIRGLFPVDTEDSRGVAEVEAEITEMALGLDHMGRPRPTSWVKASDAIRSFPKPYLDAPEFRKLLTEQGVTNPNDYADHLNFIGEITFFPRNPIYNPAQPELEDVVVLKPDWLLQKISLVLEYDQVRNSGGSFTIEHQKAVWDDLPRGIQEYLLRLMEHFDLAYRTEAQPVRSIVVELCPEDRSPNALAAWDASLEKPAESVALEYRFETTIPPGLPTWFIARCHKLTTPDHHWRRGALLRDRDHRHLAMIQSELDSKKVSLAVRGPIPYNFFALLKDCFEGTLERFPGLANRVDRIVPCGGSPKCPGFRLEDLEGLFREGITEVPCFTCRKKHQIPKLLMGITALGNDELLRLVRGIDAKADTLIHGHQEILALLQREFLKLFQREQSLAESHCPPVFTLEFERLPDVLRNFLEGAWDSLSDAQVPIALTLYCNQPGNWHAVKSYHVTRPAQMLVRLAPLAKRLHGLASKLKVVLPPASAGLGIAEELLKTPDWADRVSPLVETLGEQIRPGAAKDVSLYDLRALLLEIAPTETDHWGGLLKIPTQQFHYLWLCAEHRALYR